MFHFFNLKISFSMSKWSFKKNTIAIFIIFFGVTLRIFLNEKIGIPNFEAVTALSLLSGSFLGGIYVVVVPLLTMVFSDLYFGNTSILFFTWSAFMIIGIFGWLLRKRKSFSPRFIGKMTADRSARRACHPRRNAAPGTRARCRRKCGGRGR